MYVWGGHIPWNWNYSGEVPCRCRELNPGSLEEQPEWSVLLIVKPTLQYPFLFLKRKTLKQIYQPFSILRTPSTNIRIEGNLLTITSNVYWLVSCQLVTSYKHLGRRNLDWETASIRLACRQACVYFLDWCLTTDVGGSRPLWVVSPLGWWFWVL